MNIYNRTAALFLVAALAACASTGERVTPAMWADAQAHAARLSGGTLGLGNAVPTMIEHRPIDEICEIVGRCPNAAAYGDGVALFRDDRPWRSDRGHHFGIVIHEAVHSLQSRFMSQACRERQAHVIQVLWLEEQGDPVRAADVAANGQQYDCDPANAPIRQAAKR